MKTLWILSAFIGLTLSEKLDRTYLPPPGSKFSGGSLGEIDVPLEFPKETYPSNAVDNNFGRPEIAIGIDRVGSNISPEKLGDITSTVPLFHGNSYGFPTTTTSYAFSQTTSYVPAVDSTPGPEVSISSKYPFNNSFNILSPDTLKDKNLSFDHARPNNVYNAVEDKRILNDINNDIENQLPDNRINSQVLQKISDDRGSSNTGVVNSIPEIHSYSGDLGIPGTTSTRTEVDHSLLNNNYDSNHSFPISESINEDVNLISSTSMPLDNVHSKISSKYVPTSPIGITNVPYSYRTRPERVQAQDREAVILNYDNTITPDSYAYSFDTSNGIHAEEKGITINGVQAVGSYSYIGDDGKLYSVNYTADENGFRPYGVHLPTAPPIPDAILKVIEQAALDKANGIYDDGSYDENKYGYRNYDPTKNNQYLNQYNKERGGINLNKNLSNNQLPHYATLGENPNMDNYKVIENKQNVIPKNNFIKNKLVNESLSEFSPNYKSKDFEHKGNGDKESSNNDYKNKFQNKILNSMPLLTDKEKEDRIKSIEFYDETGYHYSKPENDFSLKDEDKLINRFTDTPPSIKIPAMYKKAVENVPVRLFMTPYVSRNDDNFVEHDEGDEHSLDVPTEYTEEENVILSNQYNGHVPTSAETKMIPGKTENRITHTFNNKFIQPNISPSDGQGYLYSKNLNTHNNSYVPYITSTEIGLPDIKSTIPTAFPSRFNTVEFNKYNNSRNPPQLSESILFQNKVAVPHPSLDEEKYHGPSTHSNTLDNYGNKNNYDITDSGFRYNMPDKYGAVRDDIMDHSTAKTYREDFSGPKQAQKYDPLTGYHY